MDFNAVKRSLLPTLLHHLTIHSKDTPVAREPGSFASGSQAYVIWSKGEVMMASLLDNNASSFSFVTLCQADGRR